MGDRCSTAEWLANQFVPGYSSQPRASISARSFRAYGHNAARILGGKFIEDARPGICKNHEIALLVAARVTTRVLLHLEIPLLAFAAYHEEGEGYGGYDFIDAPHVAHAFGDAFLLLPKDVLEKPIDVGALERAIGKDKDIRYWNPKRIGDVFFNFWD